jgi:hypothetical protein
MMTAMQAEGLLNALRDMHVCDAECTHGCVLAGLEPVLPGDRALIEALAHA